MKDVRYLIRLAHDGAFSPVDHTVVLRRVRRLVEPFQAKAINLRISSTAVEFDLFCAPQAELQPMEFALTEIGSVLTVKRLFESPSQESLGVQSPDRAVIVGEARAMFNAQRFWEVHEVLENLWRTLRGPEKQVVQALILVAAAFVHTQKDEASIARRMLQEALLRLNSAPDVYEGWDLRTFREHLQRFERGETSLIPTV